MSRVAGWLFFGFLLKFTAVGLLGRVLRQARRDGLESILGAWVLIQITLLAWMLMLSVFHFLTPGGVWLGIGGITLGLGIYTFSKKLISPCVAVPPNDLKIFYSASGQLALFGIMAVFAVLAYRSLYFFDTTWDGLTYGLPRISYYAQRHTLFAHEPTRAINIFTNEWNGELNSLFYVLITGNDQASSFGNVEIWLFACVGYAWLAGILGAPPRFWLVCGVALGATPALLGLAMTVKGDLLSIGGLAVALGFIIRSLIPTGQVFSFVLAFGTLGLVSGAKITTLPSVILLATVLGGVLIKSRELEEGAKKAGLVGGIGLFLIGNARYIVNLFVYGNPLLHLESGQPAVDKLWGNLKGILNSSFDIVQKGVQLQGPFWVLAGHLGLLSIMLLTWLIIGLGLSYMRRPSYTVPPPAAKLSSYSWILLSLSLGIGLLLLLLSTVWMPWSFRYFAPWVMIGLMPMIAWPFRYIPLRLTSLTVMLWLLMITSNTILAVWPLGEGKPTAFRDAMGRSQVERKLAFHPYLYQGKAGLTQVRFNSLFSCTSVLILNQIDSAIYPFFGDNHQRRVELADNLRTLSQKMANKHYGLIVFSGPPGEDEAQAFPLLEAQGYALSISSGFWRVFQPAHSNPPSEVCGVSE